jgi:hypothetical protein
MYIPFGLQSAQMFNFCPLLHTSSSPFPITLPSSLSNALPYFPPIFTRRTRGHCLRSFKAVNVSHSPRNNNGKCSAFHFSLHPPPPHPLPSLFLSLSRLRILFSLQWLKYVDSSIKECKFKNYQNCYATCSDTTKKF